MADPNNFLCEGDTLYCPGLANAGLSCLLMADSFEAAACLRATQGPFQSTGALTQRLLSDMVYTPEAVLRGRALSRRCISGPGTET